MQLQVENHIFKGLQLDLSPSKVSSDILYDAKNIRLTARENSTLLSITNERGPLPTTICIEGNYLGHCLLKEFLIIFSVELTQSYITRIHLNENPIKCKQLVAMNLNFDIKHPIEAIASYENENILKVYWTDNYNQPRVINIAPSLDNYIDNYTSNSFDFILKLELQETIKVKKIYGNGMFPSGVIQYAFTYYKKYGLESNVFYTSPLLYIAHPDRAGSPEETIDNSFELKIANPDNHFDFIRIYSILRTSINGTPIVKRILDLPLNTIIKGSSTFINKEDNYLYNGDNISKNKISIDNGITFLDLNSVEFNTIKYDFNDSKSPKPKFPQYLSDINLFENQAKTQSVTLYCFKKSEFPKLVILGNGYSFFWKEDTTSDSVIYLITCFNKTALFGENLNGTESRNFYRIQKDEFISNNIIQFVDTGNIGEVIDPTELLYKGGEKIKVLTFTLKDNTLFLGGILIIKPSIPQDIKSEISDKKGNINCKTSIRLYKEVSKGDLKYLNTLDSSENDDYQGVASFKSKEYYRLGIQFLYETGLWSEPCWIGDKQQSENCSYDNETNQVSVPEFTFTLDTNIVNKIIDLKYKRVRALFVFPLALDRTILCQGIGCSTIRKGIDDKADYNNYQSSWLFRAYRKNADAYNGKFLYDNEDSCGTPSWAIEKPLLSKYISVDDLDHEGLRNFANLPVTEWKDYKMLSTEIMGNYDKSQQFVVSDDVITLHSPETVFDSSFNNLALDNTKIKYKGYITLSTTYGDMDILVSSPAISATTEEFIPKVRKAKGYGALISGYLYEDLIVTFNPFTSSYQLGTMSSVYFPIYMWHKNGSLNNDKFRENRSALLSKKRISNYRYSNSITYDDSEDLFNSSDILIFNSDLPSIVKINNKIYQGNINQLLVPKESNHYFKFSTWGKLDYLLESNYVTKARDFYYFDFKSIGGNLSYWTRSGWYSDGALGQGLKTGLALDKDLCRWRDKVSMKYKSTPHIVISKLVEEQSSNLYNDCTVDGNLPIYEVITESVNPFGGKTDLALKANTWIPCGPIKELEYGSDAIIEFKWGDTYFQRYECLKTYPYTPEDVNQVIEIASFMCETRVNIDGRYDRNRGQVSNLNMSPTNFNLLNPVYSQSDNFFNYKILDSDFYELNDFPNQITWTKEKHPAAEVDLWTNITLASTYNMNGSKGKVVSLNTYNDHIYCFQEKGISDILFNSRVLIPVSDGVPIEISNSYKMDGCRYISDNLGCINKETIKEASSGIYFIDSITNDLYHIGESLSNLSSSLNMHMWFKNTDIFKTVYDSVNHDLYVLPKEGQALCYSEILNLFTSFMDYTGIQLMESYNKSIFSLYGNKLYEMFKGEYNIFFKGEYKPWSISFISNGQPNSTINLDKTFSNIEYRMDCYKKNEATLKYELDSNKSFDYIQVENEYQDTGITTFKDKPSNLKKKFRIWHIDIPRNKVIKDTDGTYKTTGKRDRIRNPWCKITLGVSNTETIHKAELHDIAVLQYI